MRPRRTNVPGCGAGGAKSGSQPLKAKNVRGAPTSRQREKEGSRKMRRQLRIEPTGLVVSRPTAAFLRSPLSESSIAGKPSILPPSPAAVGIDRTSPRLFSAVTREMSASLSRVLELRLRHGSKGPRRQGYQRVALVATASGRGAAVSPDGLIRSGR